MLKKGGKFLIYLCAFSLVRESLNAQDNSATQLDSPRELCLNASEPDPSTMVLAPNSADQINELVARENVIELWESILSQDQRKILNAAMNVPVQEGKRLRSQIDAHLEKQTRLDDCLVEAVEFSVTVLELRGKLKGVKFFSS